MPIGGKRAAVQNPFLRYAEEALDLQRGITIPGLDAMLTKHPQRLMTG